MISITINTNVNEIDFSNHTNCAKVETVNKVFLLLNLDLMRLLKFSKQCKYHICFCVMDKLKHINSFKLIILFSRSSVRVSSLFIFINNVVSLSKVGVLADCHQ